MSALEQPKSPNGTSVPGPRAPATQQPFVYTAPPQGEHVGKPPRSGPPKLYLFFDILTKLIASASLLGILVILAMLLEETKKGRANISSLSGAVSNLQYAMGSLGFSSPINVQMDQLNSAFRVNVDTTSFDPIYMQMAS